MARTPRLKVYALAAGFTEAVVAAPNRKAALQAWGSHGDDFATGGAREVTEPDVVEAALAQPGVVLKRPVGSAEELVAATKPPPRRAVSSPKKATAKARPKPDRRPLDEAEAAVKAAERDRRDLLRDQTREREALESQQAEARETADAQVERLRTAREAAQAAYGTAKG